jgi:hypothetical protein
MTMIDTDAPSLNKVFGVTDHKVLGRTRLWRTQTGRSFCRHALP